MNCANTVWCLGDPQEIMWNITPAEIPLKAAEVGCSGLFPEFLSCLCSTSEAVIAVGSCSSHCWSPVGADCCGAELLSQ